MEHTYSSVNESWLQPGRRALHLLQTPDRTLFNKNPLQIIRNLQNPIRRNPPELPKASQQCRHFVSLAIAHGSGQE